jgi:signal transduction histidine kinase
MPAIVMLALWAYDGYVGEANATRDEAANAADDLMILADARARSDLDVLRVLAGSAALQSLDDVEAGRNRALEVIDLVDGWIAVVLSARTDGKVIFTASRTRTVSDDLQADVVLHADLPTGPFLGVFRDGGFCPCVKIAVTLPEQENRVLTAYIDPAVYQQTLQAGLPRDAVAGIVDREGRFLARSLDYLDRVGTFGTPYVLGAVARGGRGIYEGRTFEGLVNYTAYTTSELTGWSSHVAIDVALLNAPLRRANRVLIGGALAATSGAILLLVLVLRDISSRRREAERLLELQRAEALSQFTAMVIHDFRNILATIVSGLRLIKRKTMNEEIKAQIGLIESSVEKGSRLANQLLSFSHAERAESEAVPLRVLLESLQYMIVQAAGPGIKIDLRPPQMDLAVRANRDQLELAVLNLVINARDAMQGRGDLVIEARDLGDWTAICVADTGPGVALERRHSIFQPFQTDKPKGTGLGLAQVAGMARQAGGEAFVEDAEGGGARFVIRLPKVSNVVPIATQLA